MPNHRYRFQPKLVPSLAAWFIILFTSALCQWQVDRGNQKQGLLSGLDAVYAQTASPLTTTLVKQAKNFSPVIVKGHFLNAYSLLLDNQVYNRIAGYHVLTPMQTQAGTILVNRGWIARGNSRNTLPTIPTIEGEVSFEGYIYQPGKAFTLGADNWLTPSWPMRILALDYKPIATAIGVQLPPLTIRVKAEQIIEQDEQFTRQWHHKLMPAQKHYAYALQWFSMAVIMFFLWVFLNLHKTTLPTTTT